MASYAIVPERRVNKAWIVEAMIRLLAGPGVRITFDGAMSRTEEDFGHIPGAVCHNPYYGGSPRWIIPENYCITMPIEDDAVLPSLRSILHRIGIRYQVHHIEIKRGDELLFSTI